MPDQYSQGGNRDNGNAAKMFLSAEKREIVLDLYRTDTPEQREQLRSVIKRLSVILRVVSPTRKVKAEEFHQLNVETYRDLKLLFPWKDVNNSVHGLFHSAQFIQKFNDGFGLGQLSESALGKYKTLLLISDFSTFKNLPKK